MALLLALSRRLPEARDNQAKKVWRGMISDLARREDELGGKTLLIIGLGGDRRPARAARQGVRSPRDRREARSLDRQRRRRCRSRHADLKKLLPDADFVALTCPLTQETENIIDAAAWRR